jgi:hypothetical protein
VITITFDAMLTWKTQDNSHLVKEGKRKEGVIEKVVKAECNDFRIASP